jgi:glycosidase
MSELGGDATTARVAASLLLTNPGVPFVYYGEEIGMTGRKPDERIRAPFPWAGTEPGAGFTEGAPWQDFANGWQEANVASQTADPGSLLSHYRSLISLRNATPELRTASWMPLATDVRTVYAFLLVGGNEAVAVVINLGMETIVGPELRVDAAIVCSLDVRSILLADGYDEPPSVKSIVEPGYGSTGVTWQPAAALPPHSTLIVRLSP